MHRPFSNSVQKQSKLLASVGIPYEPGYDGFVELSKQIMEGRNSKQQQQAVLGVLDALLPPDAPTTFRKIFPFKQVRHLSHFTHFLPVNVTCHKHAVRSTSRYGSSSCVSVAAAITEYVLSTCCMLPIIIACLVDTVELKLIEYRTVERKPVLPFTQCCSQTVSGHWTLLFHVSYAVTNIFDFFSTCPESCCMTFLHTSATIYHTTEVPTVQLYEWHAASQILHLYHICIVSAGCSGQQS